jgi:hypothetical protein
MIKDDIILFYRTKNQSEEPINPQMTLYYMKGGQEVSKIYNITDKSVGIFTEYENDPQGLKKEMLQVDWIEVEYYIIN